MMMKRGNGDGNQRGESPFKLEPLASATEDGKLALDDVSAYNEQMGRRYALDKRTRTVVILCVVAVALIPITLVLPTNLFNISGFHSSLAQIAGGIGGRIDAASQVFAGTAAGQAMGMYLWQIIAVAFAGAGLALNGAVFQGALNNALASPSTLGIMSGATLGNVIYTLTFYAPLDSAETALREAGEAGQVSSDVNFLVLFVTSHERTLCALIGCFAVAGLVLLVAYSAGKGRISKIGLLVTGQVFALVIQGVIDMTRFYIRDHGTEAQMSALRNVVGGGFYNMWNGYQVALIALPVIVGVIVVVAMRNRLNLLAFDDQEARAMGVNVTATRIAVIAVCTVLTAFIVSCVGSIGFVGFIVPHLARKMVGPDFRFYIPASVFLGAVYLLVAYYLSNMSGLFQDSLGTLTSIVGVVFFAVMAVRQRARGNADWI